MRKLGIHHISALETDPIEFVDIVSETGCHQISVFVNPFTNQTRFPVVTRDSVPELQEKLQLTEIEIANIESFIITPATNVADFLPFFELGAELSAKGVGVHLFDADESRVVDNLSQMCEQAEIFNMDVCIEFLAFTPAWKTLIETEKLIKQVKLPRLGVGIDLLHLIRSGGSPADIKAIDQNLIAYAQICDSENLGITEDYASEAVGGRLTPGEGVFPIAEFLEALPENVRLEIEVPQPPDRPARERIKRKRQLMDVPAPIDKSGIF